MKPLFDVRLLSVFFLMVLSLPALAQGFGVAGQVSGPVQMSPSMPQQAGAEPDSGMVGHVDGIFIPAVPDHPFRVRIPVLLTHTLADGTTVAQKYYTLAARDAKGRLYREARDVVPASSDLEPPLMRTTVIDPATKTATYCWPERRTCRTVALDINPPEEETEGPSKDGKSVLKRQSLGKKTLLGVEVQGTRETRTFLPGAFGNDNPVEVVKEYWYSPELQCDLAVSRIDPRNGTQKLDFAELKLGDPGPDWFHMPDGYRMFQMRFSDNGQRFPAELEPLLEKDVANISHDELAEDLKPVEKAVAALAAAHAAGAPNDRNDAYAGQIRSRLSMDFHRMQQMQAPMQNFQNDQSGVRLRQAYREVVRSPCMAKTSPGDPASMPSSAEALKREQEAWEGLRDAWVAFMARMFPSADKAEFTTWIANERTNDLRKMQNTLRNRGCQPVVSLETSVEPLLPIIAPEKLAADLKPVDEAIAAFNALRTVPNDRNNPFFNSNGQFSNMLEMRLVSDLRMLQQNRPQMGEQYRDSEARLRQTYSAILDSPCLAKNSPGDPPNAPSSPERLAEEQQAWTTLRDRWTAFLATVFPNADRASLSLQLTQERMGELMQVQSVLRNRGCVVVPSIQGQLEQIVTGIPADKLSEGLKPVDEAVRAYAEAHTQSEPRERNEFFASNVQQQLANTLRMLQMNKPATLEQLEENDLHLNQAWRTIINSPCLEKPAPADPPTAPTSVEKLREEQRAWVKMRDAWTIWLATLFPHVDRQVLANDLTQWRTNEFVQMQTTLRNRGCGAPE